MVPPRRKATAVCIDGIRDPSSGIDGAVATMSKHDDGGSQYGHELTSDMLPCGEITSDEDFGAGN
jgi:hypothetical protein